MPCSPYRVSCKITTQNKRRLIKTSKRTVQNLKNVENDRTYSEEQRKLYKDED